MKNWGLGSAQKGVFDSKIAASPGRFQSEQSVEHKKGKNIFTDEYMNIVPLFYCARFHIFDV